MRRGRKFRALSSGQKWIFHVLPASCGNEDENIKNFRRVFRSFSNLVEIYALDCIINHMRFIVADAT